MEIKDLLAVWRHISEDTEQELALLPGVEGCRNDDIAAFLQLLPEEDAARVDVDGARYFLLGWVHTVFPIELYLQDDSHQVLITGSHAAGICACVCVFLVFVPGEYQSLSPGFLLCPLWVWLSFLFAVSRWAPHPPPSSRQTHTGHGKEETTSHAPLSTDYSMCASDPQLTWGFCRKVALWLMQPPDRLRRGSWRWIQEPLITSSSQVLWMLR